MDDQGFGLEQTMSALEGDGNMNGKDCKVGKRNDNTPGKRMRDGESNFQFQNKRPATFSTSKTFHDGADPQGSVKHGI